MHNVLQFPKLATRARMGRDDAWTQPRNEADEEWIAFRRFYAGFTVVVGALSCAFGFFLGQAVVLCAFRAMGFA